jgi:predicted RNA-binding Zn-ribbon protein involved in translation (DUF1610 family)
MQQEKVDLLCKDCGQVFSAFLSEIAEHNGKITCPGCGKTSEYRGTGVRNSPPKQN